MALLVGSLTLVALVAAVGGIATTRSVGERYEGLHRAPWSPPGWIFGLAWAALYVLMAVEAWLVAREGLDDPPTRPLRCRVSACAASPAPAHGGAAPVVQAGA